MSSVKDGVTTVPMASLLATAVATSTAAAAALTTVTVTLMTSFVSYKIITVSNIKI